MVGGIGNEAGKFQLGDTPNIVMIPEHGWSKIRTLLRLPDEIRKVCSNIPTAYYPRNCVG
jgi:hypothetical protein